MRNDWHYQRTDNALVRALKIVYQGQGLLLPLVRLSEPYFYQVLAKKLRERFETKDEKGDDQTFLDRGLAGIDNRRTVDLNIFKSI